MRVPLVHTIGKGARMLACALVLCVLPVVYGAPGDATYQRVQDAAARGDVATLRTLATALAQARGADAHLGLLAAAIVEYRTDNMVPCRQLLDSVLHASPPAEARAQAVAYKFSALVHNWAGDTEAGLADVARGLALADSAALPHERTDLLVVQGELHYELADDEAALQALAQAQRLADRSGYGRGTCLVRINMGRIRYAQERYEEAWDDFTRALACATSGGWDPIAQNCINNLAGVAATLQRFDRAQHLYDSMLTVLGDRSPELRARIKSQLGFVATEQGDHTTAVAHYREAIAISRSVNDRKGVARVQQYLSNSLWDMGRREDAIATRTEALRTSQELQQGTVEVDIRARLWEWYEAMGRCPEALEQAAYMNYLDDSLQKARFSDRMALADVRFETERKEHRIAEQQQALELAAAEDRRKNVQRVALVAAVLAATVIALLLWRTLRERQRTAAQERIVHQQRVDELMRRSELDALNAMMEGQEKERDRLAKDLHDRLGSMLSAIKHQVGALEGEVHQVRQDQSLQYGKVNRLLDEAVGEVRRISHDMITVTLARFGLVKAMEDLCDSVRVHGRLAVELNMHGLEQRMERSREITVYRIVQELISNVLKHAQATELSVGITRVPGRISVIVSDDGRGFDPNSVAHGIGLDNVRARAASIGAVVRIDSTPGRGTTVSVEGPVVE
ncbi:MAG: sensor histidine kinase [Flavobacteriales bacterium]|nr:MAG: sensor histidine kinase [Flavobacteriales bacterium]